MKKEFRPLHAVLLGLVTFGLAGVDASADEVFTQEKDGITYQVTRRTVKRPIAAWETQSRQQVVYREQVTAQTQDTLHNYVTPVTEYQWVTRMHGRWNPFVQPYYSQKMVPVTRWEPRTEIVRTPVIRREHVPELRTVQVQIPTYRMAEEVVESRVALGVAPSAGGTTVASRSASGGSADSQGQPQRLGSLGVGDSGWGSTTIQR